MRPFVLLRIFSDMITLLEITILKIFFLSNFSISFCPNTKSRKSTYLFYFRYISDFLWLYLANRNNTKDINRGAYIIAINIRKTFAKDAYINNPYIIGIWIGYASIRGACISNIYTKSAFIKDVESKTLVGSEIILTSLKTNDYYLILSMRLILASTNSTSYCSIDIWAISTAYIYLKYFLLAYKK